MILQALAFYFFAAILVASAVMVIAARNPVHSVLFLILSFFNAAGLFVLMGAEFLAMILVVVYVGAVAVLFLFVVMLLDVDLVKLREGFLQYLPIGAIIGAILAIELGMVYGSWKISEVAPAALAAKAPDPGMMSNTDALGRLIYTDYIYLFQASGLVLLVAMIGAIVLTLRHKPGVKRQDIGKQVARTPKTGMELVQIKPGEGISE